MQQSLPTHLHLHGHDVAPALAGRPQRARHQLLDRLGAVLGFACAVHCVAMPLIVGVLPALGLGFLADHAFDLAIVALASLFAFFAGRAGWRAHRDPRVIAAFISAVTLLVIGHAIGEDGLAGRVPSIIGGVMLAAAHLANLRLSNRACATHAH
jgi:hypothetical protein